VSAGDKGMTKTEVKEIVKEMVGKKGTKEKRPLTAYQKHMSGCMKKDGATFGSCVEEWRKKQK